MLEIRSPIAGSVWKLEKQAGETVGRDEAILILESMKMEFPIQAPSRGVVSKILVAESELVDEGALVALMEVS